MNTNTQIYVEFTSDLKARLNNKVRLQDALNEAGIEAEVEWGAVPPTEPEQRTKALVEIVTAGSIAAVPLAIVVKILMSAISDYLNQKAVRDSHFQFWRNKPLLDGQGQPICDKQGRPCMVRERVSGFDPLPVGPGESITITVGMKGAEVTSKRGKPADAEAKEKSSKD